MTHLMGRGRGVPTGAPRPAAGLRLLRPAAAAALLVGLVAGCSNAPVPAPAPPAAAPSSAAPASPAPTSAAPTGAAPAGGASSSAAPSTATVVVIKDYLFVPEGLTVPAGATVMVDNQDGSNHTVTAKDGSFDTGNIPGNQKGMFVAPSRPGTYPYKCAIHPFMTGTLTVT